MADGEPSALGIGRHPGSETSVGLPGEQNLYVRRGHMRSWPHHDEPLTFRGETKQRRYGDIGGSSCAVAERRYRHDMMMMTALHAYGPWTPSVYRQLSNCRTTTLLADKLAEMRTQSLMFSYVIKHVLQ